MRALVNCLTAVAIVAGVVLLPGGIHAQHPRAGVYIGSHFASIQYEFLGSMENGTSFHSAVMGVVIEQPLAEGLLLQFGGQLTRYGGGAFFYRVFKDDALMNVYAYGSFNELWIVELPLALKYLPFDGAWRPYIAGGPVLGVGTPPEDIWISYDGSEGYDYHYETYDFSALHVGARIGAGLEIATLPSFMITAGVSMTQLLRPSVDTPAVRVRNTPYFQALFGVLFSLSAEDWQ